MPNVLHEAAGPAKDFMQIHNIGSKGLEDQQNILPEIGFYTSTLDGSTARVLKLLIKMSIRIFETMFRNTVYTISEPRKHSDSFQKYYFDENFKKIITFGFWPN